MFPMNDFVQLNKKALAQYSLQTSNLQDNTIDQMSPIHPVEDRQNWFKENPDKDLQVKLGKMKQGQLSELSKKFLEEDREDLRQESSKHAER